MENMLHGVLLPYWNDKDKTQSHSVKAGFRCINKFTIDFLPNQGIINAAG
jgi:hypothetical protein